MITPERPAGRVARWLGTTVSPGLTALAVLASPTTPAHAAAKADCAAANGASFICGVTNVEDVAPVPHTKWVIGSDLAAASHPQGYLHVFDTSNNTVKAVQPAEIAIRPDKNTCPGQPDMKTFGPHGLDLTQTGTRYILYAVNHGGREAVEVFTVDLSKARPAHWDLSC